MGKRKAALSGQVADQDIKLLRVFKTVVESGGFSAAEVPLNLANSTICNYVADLEKRLDMRLCERGRSGFALTERGKMVYDATLELLGALEQFRQRVNVSHDRIMGDLHLGCAEHLMALQRDLLIEALKCYTKKAPDVRMRISTMMSDDVIPSVLEGRIQLGVTVLVNPIPNLESLYLFEEDMVLYCGKGHPLFDASPKNYSIESLQNYAFVESPRLQAGREVTPQMASWRKQAVAHHQEARAQLILTGHYLAYLPECLVEAWGMQGQVRPLFREQLSYRNTFYALYKLGAQKNPVVSAFLECLQQAYQ